MLSESYRNNNLGVCFTPAHYEKNGGWFSIIRSKFSCSQFIKGLDVGNQGSTEIGDGILHAGRNIRKQLPADDAVGGVLFEHLRQDFL